MAGFGDRENDTREGAKRERESAPRPRCITITISFILVHDLNYRRSVFPYRGPRSFGGGSVGGGGGGGDEDGSRFIFAGYPSLSTHSVAVRPRPCPGSPALCSIRMFHCVFINPASAHRYFIPLLLISLANLDPPLPTKTIPPPPPPPAPRRAFIQSEKGSNYMAP